MHSHSNKNNYYKLSGLRAKSVAVDPLYKSNNQNNHKNPTKNVSMIKANRNKYKLMGKPPIGERQMKFFFGFSLDEREMPITRERSTRFQVNTTIRNAIDSNHRKPLKSSDDNAYHDRNRYLYYLSLLKFNIACRINCS